MYEVIVLGATFAAAGIARQLEKKCLVLERRAQAGYEFFGALRFDIGEAAIYNWLKSCDTLFCAELIRVKKTETGFACQVHGVNGYCTYYAKKVVDTRCNEAMSLSKTYNLLIESKERPAFDCAHCEQISEDRYLISCPVPLSCGYVQARRIALDLITQFTQTQRLILSASAFDYRVKPDYPQNEDGILRLPSKAYDSSSCAFEAGSRMGEELSR